ncbi:DUF1998 domain-containing protein [Streptomyces sp. NBC_00191]|uniref:DrmB family protein n=1 Tax=Streptomyces sp. NBC_00191 TaxID=2975674 RepID=UPI003251E566
MIEGKVRRAHLVTPFGPGAMQVLSDGTSVITAGLDYWFTPVADTPLDVEAFRVNEWRLEKDLGVNALYTPPDYRRRSQYAGDQTNTSLPVPVLRFPAWSFCPKCRELTRQPLHTIDKPRCKSCKSGTRPKGPFLAQVPFVALCEHGHMQDFPWSEWVHYSESPKCQRIKLELRTSGGGTLGSQRVTCKGCNKSRSLRGITSTARSSDGESESTRLTTALEHGREYSCRGGAPWLGIEEVGKSCGAPLRATLRGASNVYYALVKSSIFIPETVSGSADREVIATLEEDTISGAIRTVQTIMGPDVPIPARTLRNAAKGNAWRLSEFDDKQIEEALSVLTRRGESDNPSISEGGNQAPFREQEHARIRETLESTDLVVRQSTETYDKTLSSVVSRVRLVEKLRETRVLWGFNRIFAESDMEKASRSALLRKTDVPQQNSWLPAYTVMGEGIYIELDSAKLSHWENDDRVGRRLAPLIAKFNHVTEERRLQKRNVSPRLVLIHTLAHLLINQLTYECGYSSASLRERLYVSPGATGMAGLLIYTAAGDSEGTLGGLVRMGQPGRLEGVLNSAIAAARWCSSDPVCIDSKGQGPDSCNLAACHGCGLLPETACEEFNRFLDRALVVGTLSEPDLGFFSQLG